MTARSVAAAAALAILMTACSSTSGSGSGSLDEVQVQLTHVPRGTISLTENGAAQLSFQVSGLAPGSGHPVELVVGACGSAGEAITVPTNISADSHGVAEGTVRINFITHAVGSVRSFRIHAGPGDATSDQRREIGCALLATSGTGSTGRIGPRRDSDSRGTATLSYDKVSRILTVTVSAHGLEPGSIHPNHIHTGQCTLQGPVRHVLRPLLADAHGDASATTEIPQVDRILNGIWYVAVHQGPGLDVPEQFSPILCGDVGN